ncbi:SUMF1/EgtB/PvdO family nonheme iron enzyme [Desulfobacterales bacterium HSG16]|nr:SUMF1/EgtB/PvdO family nonheme iron enzyme [Desulfobacterales bacterium HSG16]
MNRTSKIAIIFVFVLAVFPLLSHLEAANKGIERKKTSDYANAARVALVIGNANYKVGWLKNPVNDAVDMAKALKSLGFEVIIGKNQTYQEMWSSIRSFGDRIKGNKVGLFYYSGHGIQVDGVNYLLPVGSKIEREDEVHFQAIAADLVLNKMRSAENSLNMVILDACRNNPYTKAWHKGADDQGLASMRKMIPPTGILIFYATNSKGVAADGYGRNSPFTASLKERIVEPGLELRKMVSLVAGDVINRSGNEQFPWQEGMVLGDFYFADSSGATVVTPDPVRKPRKPARLEIQVNTEKAETWINGKSYGSTRVFTIKTAGEYRVKVTADGFEPYSTQERIEKGQTVIVKAMLEKIEPEPQPISPVTQVSTYTGPVPGQNYTDLELGMEFVWVKNGCYQMGCGSWAGDCQSDEKPVHKVCLDGFWIGKYEVTRGQWKEFVSDNGYGGDFKNEYGCSGMGNPKFSQADNHPVACVSWKEVSAFANWLSDKTGNNFRLPTEAEWEYAARSGGKKQKYAGGNNIDSLGWYDSNSGSKTHPVGQKKKNGLGIYDMSGNVWEWCQDWYDSGYYKNSPQSNPGGPASGRGRVDRGGGWSGYAAYCRSAYRSLSSPGYRYYSLGFRLALSPQVSR